MSLSEAQVEAEARLLDQAERARRQIRQTTSVHPDMTIEDAYRVQASWLRLRLRRGERLIGHKVGLTSHAMQQAMNITNPDSGFLTCAMVFSPGQGPPAEDFCDPRIEVELAFVLGSDLEGEDLDVDDVLNATEYVTPAVEIIAARTFRTDPATGRTRTVTDTIADNAADAGIVCGGRRVGPREVDLRWVGALAYRNGTITETGLAAGVLDHPARGIAWLARRYAAQGRSLEAGQTILAGSFTRPMPVESGDVFGFDYGPLGAFEVEFG